jgi:hypothetical protein
MKNRTLTAEINIEDEKIKINKSINKIFEENDELIDSIEKLTMQNYMTNTICTEMMAKTDKLLKTMTELSLSY